MNSINDAAADRAATTPGGDKVDRDIPQLQTKRKTKTPLRLALVAIALLMVLLIGVAAVAFMDRLQNKKAEEVAAKAKARPVSTAPTKTDFEGFKKRLKAEEAAAAAPEQAAGSLAVPVSARGNFADAKTTDQSRAGGSGYPASQAGAGSTSQPQAPARPRHQTREQRQLSGDLFVGEEEGDTGASGTKVGMPMPQLSQQSQLPLMPSAEPRQSALEQQMTPSKLQGVAAVRRKNLDLLMLAGTIIPCGQRTYIVSTNPGQATCVVSKDVYSANGSTLLIERGSKVLGERHQPLQLGQKMMPVLWNRIDTPSGVTVDINSLAADSLGASGLSVYVDEHFRERFGAAIMLSLISDLGDAAANAASNGGSTIRLGTTAGAGQDLANKALERTINIPPTGYSVQGSAINIFVSRDVDFGGVYELARY